MRTEANMLKALGNELRLNILMALHKQDGLGTNVGEIQQITGYPQSTVSQHLAKLRDNQIVKTQREGTKIYYKISNPMVNQVLSIIQK